MSVKPSPGQPPYGEKTLSPARAKTVPAWKRMFGGGMGFPVLTPAGVFSVPKFLDMKFDNIIHDAVHHFTIHVVD